MNANLFIGTSDWHLGRTGTIQPATALAAAQHIASRNPFGAFDLGDCKDRHDGTDAASQLADYVANVKNVMPWAVTREGTDPILPGNHDDRNADETLPTDFSQFDAAIKPAPYHFSIDWPAPRVRFVAAHARIVKPGEGPTLPYPGMFTIAPEERQWVRDQLASLPDGWSAICASHPPLHPAFGNNIGTQWPWLPAYGGTDLAAILRDSGKVVAYINGHRHDNMKTAVLDGITHFDGPGVAYTIGNGLGGYTEITYQPSARTLTFDYLLGRAPFARYPGYVPVVVQLPPLTEPPPDPEPSFTFTATGTVTMDGVEHSASLSGTGTIT